MTIELFIYLANVLDNVGWVCFWAGIIALAAGFFTFLYNCAEHTDDYKHPIWTRLNTGLAALSFTLLLVFALMPSERTMYMIAGAGLAKTAVQSDTAAKVQKLVNAKLDDMIDGLTKKGK